MLVLLDQQEKICWMNKKASDILKISSRDLIGENWFSSFIPKPIQKEAKELFLLLLHDKISMDVYSILMEDMQGQIILWHKLLLKSEYNQEKKVLALGIDLSVCSFVNQFQHLKMVPPLDKSHDL